MLELGVGTGLSLQAYPPGIELTAIDISPRMLARAQGRAARLGRKAALEVADIQRLPYSDASFDTVTAACVFCSVADPIRGLREAGRVVRPGGQVLLYEHVRPRNPLLGKATDLNSPLTRRLFGPELNRRTERNAVAAGLRITEIRSRASGARSWQPPNVPDPPLHTATSRRHSGLLGRGRKTGSPGSVCERSPHPAHI